MTPSFAAAIDQLNTIILGKPRQIRLALACMLAQGHLLLEDLPGVGKTTLAHALAGTLGLQFQRVQFTSDLLPADLVGVSIYARDSDTFRFHHGPVFSQVLLADEINRAPPKTQSALLEAMEENQVTVDGKTHPLPEPFFVIATQNPQYQIGTFPLPESQLDRFLMRLELGYPSAQPNALCWRVKTDAKCSRISSPASTPPTCSRRNKPSSKSNWRPPCSITFRRWLRRRVRSSALAMACRRALCWAWLA